MQDLRWKRWTRGRGRYIHSVDLIDYLQLPVIPPQFLIIFLFQPEREREERERMMGFWRFVQ